MQSVLDTFPTVPVLGLSATNIRYLDNQRDMADELFDGNVASEMTLGEAIVRGILNPPKYVLSVFQYQKDLDKYAYRVRHAKNKAVRDSGEKYLEALRRALDKADGLPEIFNKHIPNQNGKYIVVCANVEHMDEMVSHVREWFGGIDSTPHVYKAYSDDPETSKAFADFKKDDSNHLKLLFCIDMLNEGVHVEDISGVILLRPTVSPIIYKQQIGRALSASKTTNAVIFDIVMNIDNLYSIGTIQDEMQVVMTYYRERGLENEIVNSSFKVIDEVCEELNRKGINYKWFIIGDGSEREQAQAEIAKRGLQNRLYLLGAKKNPYPYYKACDLYCQTSKSEAYCTTVNEARIFNKPIVSTMFPGITEQLADGQGGIIVEITPRAIAEGIIKIIEMSELDKQNMLKKSAYPNALEENAGNKFFEIIGQKTN